MTHERAAHAHTHELNNFLTTSTLQTHIKQLVRQPDVVEVHDVTSADPRLLVFLKSCRNTVQGRLRGLDDGMDVHNQLLWLGPEP